VEPGWATQLPLVGLVFARCGGLMALMPPLNLRQFPVTLRLGIAGALAVALAPVAVVSPSAAEPSLAAYVALLVREAAVGALLGLGAALVFWAFTIAGQLIDTYLGAGDAVSRGQGRGPMAMLLYLTAGAAFLASDAHHWVLAALAGGLQELPIGQAALTAGGLEGVTGLVREMLVVGVAVAAPALAVIYAAEVALAAFVRCLPHLGPADLHAPVRWSAGMLGLAASAPLLASVLGYQAERVIEAMRAITALLAGGG